MSTAEDRVLEEQISLVARAALRIARADRDSPPPAVRRMLDDAQAFVAALRDGVDRLPAGHPLLTGAREVLADAELVCHLAQGSGDDGELALLAVALERHAGRAPGP